ncbi:hypothetical protein LINPERPRIM_LOCUS13760 [Linum perenne]
MVHCKSNEDDLGIHYVGDGKEYSWKLRPEMLSPGSTQLWCYVGPVTVAYHTYVYVDPSFYEHNSDVYWVVNRKGVSIRDSVGGKIYVSYSWAPGLTN